MRLLRTRFKKDIVCEFLPPTKPARKVLILCGGMPSYPGGRKELAEFLIKQGYWVFLPRYRGSWESGGSFLEISPDRDVIDMIDQLPKGFKDLWSGKIYKIEQPEIYLIGSSFGGAAVILASRDPRVKKVVALSPVTDWRVESKIESVNQLRIFAKEAFGEAYRFTDKNWRKLKTGKFYNPVREINSIDGEKLLIIHAKDDEIVYAKTSINFAKETGARLQLLNKGGHLSLSHIQSAGFWGKIKSFLR